MEESLVRLLLGVEVQHALLAAGGTDQQEATDVQSLPEEQRLHRAQLEGLQGVGDQEGVAIAVQRDLLEESLQQALLLDQPHVLEQVAGHLEGLVQARLLAVRDVVHGQHGRAEARVEEVGGQQRRLEVRGPGQHQSLDARLVAGRVDEVLGGQLRAATEEVVALLQTKPSESERGLSAAAVLLGQVDGELEEHVPRTALHGREETAITVHDDEAEGIVLREHHLGQGLRVEAIVAEVERGRDRLQRLEGNVDLLLFAFFHLDIAAEHGQSVGRNLGELLQALLQRGDGSEHRIPGEFPS